MFKFALAWSVVRTGTGNGIILCFHSVAMYFVDFQFCFRYFWKMTAKFWFCSNRFKILKFQTWRWRKLKKPISQLPSGSLFRNINEIFNPQPKPGSSFSRWSYSFWWNTLSIHTHFLSKHSIKCFVDDAMFAQVHSPSRTKDETYHQYYISIGTCWCNLINTCRYIKPFFPQILCIMLTYIGSLLSEKAVNPNLARISMAEEEYTDTFG